MSATTLNSGSLVVGSVTLFLGLLLTVALLGGGIALVVFVFSRVFRRDVVTGRGNHPLWDDGAVQVHSLLGNTTCTPYAFVMMKNIGAVRLESVTVIMGSKQGTVNTTSLHFHAYHVDPGQIARMSSHWVPLGFSVRGLEVKSVTYRLTRPEEAAAFHKGESGLPPRLKSSAGKLIA